MLKLIPTANYQVMPWKNGKGTTSEIAIFPKGADFSSGNFIWRLSLAHVRTSGPFSQFPGFDRKLVIAEGKEIILNGHILAPLQVFSFAGEEVIESTLSDGAITDLGIISKRGAIRTEINFFSEKSDSMRIEAIPGSIHYLYCSQGSFGVRTRPPRNENILIKTGETLEITTTDELVLTPHSSLFTAVLISIYTI